MAQAIEAGGRRCGAYGRTREQFYSGRTDWNIVAADEESRQDSGDWKRRRDRCHLAYRMMQETGCDFVDDRPRRSATHGSLRGLARAWDAGVFDAPRTEGREVEPGGRRAIRRMLQEHWPHNLRS